MMNLTGIIMSKSQTKDVCNRISFRWSGRTGSTNGWEQLPVGAEMLMGLRSKGAFGDNGDVLDHSLGGGYPVMYVCMHGYTYTYVCVKGHVAVYLRSIYFAVYKLGRNLEIYSLIYGILENRLKNKLRQLREIVFLEAEKVWGRKLVACF